MERQDRKKEKAEGKRAVAASWKKEKKKKKVQNLLLKYSFGQKAPNMPHTGTFFQFVSD